MQSYGFISIYVVAIEVDEFPVPPASWLTSYKALKYRLLDRDTT